MLLLRCKDELFNLKAEPLEIIFAKNITQELIISSKKSNYDPRDRFSSVFTQTQISPLQKYGELQTSSVSSADDSVRLSIKENLTRHRQGTCLNAKLTHNTRSNNKNLPHLP